MKDNNIPKTLKYNKSTKLPKDHYDFIFNPWYYEEKGFVITDGSYKRSEKYLIFKNQFNYDN